MYDIFTKEGEEIFELIGSFNKAERLAKIIAAYSDKTVVIKSVGGFPEFEALIDPNGDRTIIKNEPIPHDEGYFLQDE